MYLFGVKYCYNLDRLQIACCHLVFVKKSPSFQNVDIFPELDRGTPCVFIGTVARFTRNKSLLISFGAPVVILQPDWLLFNSLGTGAINKQKYKTGKVFGLNFINT